LGGDPLGRIVVIPLTTKAKGISLHVQVSPPEGGLDHTSYIKCEDVRAISKQRLLKPLGKVSPSTVAKVEDRLRILPGLCRPQEAPAAIPLGPHVSRLTYHVNRMVHEAQVGAFDVRPA